MNTVRLIDSLASLPAKAKLAVVPALINAIEDPDPLVSAEAATALGEIGPVDRYIVSTLLFALGDKRNEVSLAAEEALKKIGSEAIPDLSDILMCPHLVIRANATYALEKIGSEDTVPALITALHFDNNRVKMAAAYALGKIGVAAKDSVPALKIILGNKDNGVKVAVAYALSKIGVAAKEAVPDLILALETTRSRGVRIAVSDALGDIGIDAIEAIPTLTKALSINETRTRTNEIVTQHIETAIEKITR